MAGSAEKRANGSEVPHRATAGRSSRQAPDTIADSSNRISTEMRLLQHLLKPIYQLLGAADFFFVEWRGATVGRRVQRSAPPAGGLAA